MGDWGEREGKGSLDRGADGGAGLGVYMSSQMHLTDIPGIARSAAISTSDECHKLRFRGPVRTSLLACERKGKGCNGMKLE